MTLHEFENAARVLHSIDGHEVPWMTEAQWVIFSREPIRYLLRCDDRTADAIWSVVERRCAPQRESTI